MWINRKVRPFCFWCKNSLAICDVGSGGYVTEQWLMTLYPHWRKVDESNRATLDGHSWGRHRGERTCIGEAATMACRPRPNLHVVDRQPIVSDARSLRHPTLTWSDVHMEGANTHDLGRQWWSPSASRMTNAKACVRGHGHRPRTKTYRSRGGHHHRQRVIVGCGDGCERGMTVNLD